jgi:hypothetical protein
MENGVDARINAVDEAWQKRMLLLVMTMVIALMSLH